MVKVYLDIEEMGKTVDAADDYTQTTALMNALGGKVVSQQTYKDKTNADGTPTGQALTSVEAQFGDSTDKLLITIGDHGFYVLDHVRKSGTGAHIIKLTNDASKSVYPKIEARAEGPVATPFNNSAFSKMSLEDMDGMYMMSARASHVAFTMNG